MDILQIALPEAEAKQALEAMIKEGADIILFDALYQDQMAGIGRLIDSYADNQQLFSVGSSGIEMALGSYWQQQGALQKTQSWKQPGRAEPLLVASGSCSPVTAAQIVWATAQGFAEVALNTEAIATESGETVLDDYIKTVETYINNGQSVIIHTSRGADDERVAKTDEVFLKKGFNANDTRTKTAQLYGTALGGIVRGVAEKTNLKRIVIAGGDTSSFAAREMGIEAVEMIAPLSPGAPLCKAHAPLSPIDGLEVNFKGGQVGREDYFGMVLEGKFITNQPV